MYYLTKFDYVMQSGFSVIPKITSANLCKPIHDIINYFLIKIIHVIKKRDSSQGDQS